MIVVEVRGDRVVVRYAELRDICRAIYVLTQLIPIGYVTSYRDIGRVLGIHPRTVARCLMRNRHYVVTPCHRVIYSSSRLGGYSKLGSVFKKKILELEGVVFENHDRVSRRHMINFSDLIHGDNPG